MRKILYLICFYFTLSTNSQVATITKKIINKFGKEIAEKGLSKTSREASENISKRLSKTAVIKLSPGKNISRMVLAQTFKNRTWGMYYTAVSKEVTDFPFWPMKKKLRFLF